MSGFDHHFSNRPTFVIHRQAAHVSDRSIYGLYLVAIDRTATPKMPVPLVVLTPVRFNFLFGGCPHNWEVTVSPDGAAVQ